MPEKNVLADNFDMADIMRQSLDPQSGAHGWENAIQEKYPDIPSPLCVIWNRSDESMEHDLSRIEELQKTATSLERAAQSLRQISERTSPMSLKSLKASIRSISGAIGHAEAQLDMLRMDYPLPNEKERWQWYEEDKYLRELLPRFLHISEDSIILWLPRMPSKSRINNSLVFAQMKDLLHMTELPHIQQWHCDFYHVFQESTTILSIRDVDNYPYKPVIDALARALHTSDKAFDFSIGMYNLLTNTIKPGCYIRIIKRDKKVQEFQNFEECILSILDNSTP